MSPTFPSTLSSDENKEQDRPYEEYIADEAQTVTRYDILAAALQKLAPGTWQEPGESIGAAVNRLQHALDVDRIGSTFQISIALTMDDPRRAASVVNAVTEPLLPRRTARNSTDATSAWPPCAMSAASCRRSLMRSWPSRPS